MNTLEAIETRRSIRKFMEKHVEEEKVRSILKAAMYAPSAGNQQPWQFYVIRNRKTLSRVKDFSPHAAMADDANLGILVCGDLNLERFEGFWIQDCAAAVQNLLLAAHSLGLGAVWTGVYPREERMKGFRDFLSLPKSIVPMAFIPIGYPDQTRDTPERFEENRIHIIE